MRVKDIGEPSNIRPPGTTLLNNARNTVDSLGLTNKGQEWPPSDLRTRQLAQKFSMRLYDGSYSANRKFIASIDNQDRELPYVMLKLNYFKRVIDSIIGLTFNNEVTVSADTPDNTLELQKLVDRVHFVDSMMECLKLTEIYGDSILRVYKDGINVIPPYWGMKCVDPHDIDSTKSILLYEYLYKEEATEPYAVRFEVHQPGRTLEYVREYITGSLGNTIDCMYRGRMIPSMGLTWEYKGMREIPTAYWCSLNRGVSIYGQSVLDDIKDLVFSIESLASMREYTVRENTQPFMVLGMSMFTTDEVTGTYKLKKINDRYIIRDQAGDPLYLEWGGQNTVHARELQEDLMQNLYELSEISKVAMSGDYSGNVSADTIKTASQASTERASRDLNQLWGMFQKALHALATLNGIQVKLEDINIMFNVDRTPDEKSIAEVCQIMKKFKILSAKTLRKKYLGYTDEQSDEEDKTILAENSLGQGEETV